ncbi:MAG TPA: ribonuclease P protein component [Candidatus Woesebacteria bacterium]|nr:ribonuclease P protein component [Candidatus Woesebacteria bacterium]HNS65666.1 ribonuclease P protein component [Candidatus Woesebacteria bacterium]
MLPKEHRYSSRNEIRQVFRNATRKHSNSFMWLSSQANNRANLPWRAAIIVSKKVAPLATDRNAIRRKISEALWQQKDQLKQGFDIVILAQKRSLISTAASLYQEVQLMVS